MALNTMITPLLPNILLSNDMKKLATNFHDKTNYLVHIRNLQYYLSKGMILKDIHRVNEFTQSNWLAVYIDNNSKLRQRATNDFEKDFFLQVTSFPLCESTRNGPENLGNNLKGKSFDVEYKCKT